MAKRDEYEMKELECGHMHLVAKRGRPKGSRNVAVTRPHWLQVRLTEDEAGWLKSRAVRGETMSEVVRRLIELERKRDP